MIKAFLKTLNSIHKDNNVSLEAKHLLTILIKYHNHDLGYSFPTYENLMEECSTNRRAKISKIVKELSEKEYITIKKVYGNKSTYYINKHLYYVDKEKKKGEVKSEAKEVKKEVKPETKKETKPEIKKPSIVSDYKESEVKTNIEDISPYSQEHQQKISLVLKQNIKLTEKQMWLIGDMDLETLRKAIFRFRKSTKTNTFAFLLECYFTECSLNNIEVSKDLQRYTGNVIIPVSEEYLENQRVKDLMIEQGIFDEDAWNESIALGL